ncbi:MAG: hypothetical protein E8D42_10100 [Nitrospira sp.]|nr:MAG: hypothetical protein E8D42_10100 [Nitrospira sp.]
MKREYDFSSAVRGKFFRKGAELNVPIDIEEDRVLSNIADGRMATFDQKTAKTHAEVWGTSKRPRR